MEHSAAQSTIQPHQPCCPPPKHLLPAPPRCPPPAHLLAANRATAAPDPQEEEAFIKPSSKSAPAAAEPKGIQDEHSSESTWATSPSLEKTEEKTSAYSNFVYWNGAPKALPPGLRPSLRPLVRPLHVTPGGLLPSLRPLVRPLQPTPHVPPTLQQPPPLQPPPPPQQSPPVQPPPPVSKALIHAAQQVAYNWRVSQLLQLQAGMQTLAAQAAAKARAPAFTSAPPDSDLIGHVTIKKGSTFLKVRAALMFGSMSSVRDMLTQAAAAEADGALGISHRVPFDDLARRTPIALLAFAPDAAEDAASYSENFKYFEGKSRAGVINLKDANSKMADIASLYIAPRCALEANDHFCSLVEEGEKELGSISLAALTMLQDRDDCLVGLIASSPFLSASAVSSNSDPVLPNNVQKDVLHAQLESSSVEMYGTLAEEIVDDFPDDDVNDLQGMLEGEETEESDDGANPESTHMQLGRAPNEKEVPGIGKTEKETTNIKLESFTDVQEMEGSSDNKRETSIIELETFIGEWRDSLGNDVHVDWQSSHELLVCLSRPFNQGRDVRLCIKEGEDSQFLCGHYTLDVAPSSASRMVWRNDVSKDNGQRSRQHKSSTWVRVGSINDKKRSRSRSKLESIERKQIKRDEVEQLLPKPVAEAINTRQVSEEQPTESLLDDDLQSRLDDLLSQLA